MRKSMQDNQMKALVMALAGAALAAVSTMYVPVTMLEGFTGATGLSELIPAAAAPLGDTARALIAFAAGAMTLAIVLYLLLRNDSGNRDGATVRKERAPVLSNPALSRPTTTGASTPGPALLSAVRALSNRFVETAKAKMPWSRQESDIVDLSDLPKLRNGDSHPDAPPRRPLSAHQDLPVLDLAKIAAPEPVIVATAPVDTSEPADVPAVVEPTQAQSLVQPETPSPASIAQPERVQPTLAEMVAQLELAVSERQQQLAQLEVVAAQLGKGTEYRQLPVETPVTEIQPEPLPMIRRSLEVVPAVVKDDDMDSALAAALATLHRMNGTTR
jgi:hypothetical protein